MPKQQQIRIIDSRRSAAVSGGGVVLAGHTHDDRYYTDAEIAALLAGYLPVTGVTTGATSQAQTFTSGVIDSSLTASRLLASNGSKQLASVANLADWIAGTANRITVANDGDGTITLNIAEAGIDHGGLSGLGDDDHPQYIRHALADAAGDLLVASGADAFARYALSVPSSPTINFLGVANGETTPTWKSASSNPGAAARLLASDAKGKLLLVELSANKITLLTPRQIAQVLTASDAGANDQFGMSVALSADGAVLAVGAHLWDGAAGSDQGGVYLYDWSGSAWVQRGSVLTASDAGANDQFGTSVALSADGAVLAVGALLWDGAAGSNQGGVYLYDWNGSAWVQRGGILTASDAGASDQFGASVALSADGAVLAVGANPWDGAGGTDQGGVYLYDWNGSAWVQRGGVLTASDAGANDNFGISVALSADGAVLAVGAHLWDGAAGSNQGGVYLYDWNGSAWVQRGGVLTASDAGASDRFGFSVALSADGAVLAVGALLWDGAAGSDQGGVYLYDWNGSAWVQRGIVLTAADAETNDYFGVSVALSADGAVLAVGAQLWDGADGSNQGGVYVYALQPGALPVSAQTGNGWSALIGSELLASVGALTKAKLTTSALTLNSIDIILTAGYKIKPGADAANALQLANAAGTGIVIVDTTNSRLVLADGANVQLGTSTGSKFGVGATAKLAFHGATPIAQRSHVADPSGGATVDAEARTAINSILATLEAYGFHATS